MTDIESRLRSLLKVNAAVVGHLHVRSVLAHLAASALELTGAGYAVVRVQDANGEVVEAVGPADAEPVALVPGPDVLEVALSVRGEPFGHLVVARHPTGAFSHDDLDLLQSLATTAGIALDKARTYEATRQRERWALATAAVRIAGSSGSGPADSRADDTDATSTLLAALPGLTGATVAVRADAAGDNVELTGVGVAPGTLLPPDHALSRAVRSGRRDSIPSLRLRVPGGAIELGETFVFPAEGRPALGARGAVVIGLPIGAAAPAPDELERIAELVVEAAAIGRARTEGDASAPPVLPVDDDLSARERDVLQLIAEGMTNRQIGERLFLSEKTVKNCVTVLLRKLGMERRTQAAVYGAQLREAG